MKKLLTADLPKKRFEDFLLIPDNNRIVFSGIFGIGKTTFLKNFFGKEGGYFAVHLFPTNYTTSKNEDVFELIKFDILYELLSKSPDIETFKLEKVFAAHLALFKNGSFEPLTPLLEAIPRIGKPLAKVLSMVSQLDQQIKSEIYQANDSESAQIKQFVARVSDVIGSPYESDLITELITRLLDRFRGDVKRKVKTVLIIDDLDRIDPDQIFRILNIFSVHFDISGSENKFGFDKVLFCCDANNIRRIFANRFGTEVDFNGYFDKFYSTEIFFLTIGPRSSHVSKRYCLPSSPKTVGRGTNLNNIQRATLFSRRSNI
jgi:hypothetical protein